MRTLLLIYMFLSTLLVSAQVKDSVYRVVNQVFSVEYSYTKQQPLLLEYTINCPNGKIERSGDFWVDPRWATSDSRDYANNVWDKGHLAPAASFSCTTEQLRLTFSYLNCALQHESLNRGVWSQLEAVERALANFYQVRVIVELHFDHTCQVLPTGAVVPKGFWKTLYWEKREARFYFPNAAIKDKSWHDFMIK